MDKINYRTDLVKLLDHYQLPKIVAEVGVAEGKFSLALLKRGVDKLYLIDNWAKIEGARGMGAYPQFEHDKNFKETMYKVLPYINNVVILKGKSDEMAKNIQDESLGMVYIDAGHSYEGVMKDIIAWFPKVLKGGIVAGHDYLNLSYGVNKAIKEFVAGRFEIVIIPENETDNSSFYFIKK